MSPQQAAQNIGAFLRDSKLATGFAGAVVGAVVVGAALPGQVREIDSRVSVVETDVRSLRQVLDRRDRYAFCRWQAEDEGLDPRVCNRLLPESFLPR